MKKMHFFLISFLLIFNYFLIMRADENSEGQEKKWAVPLVFHAAITHNGFDECGKEAALAQSLIGPQFLLQDIFLLSRLSEQGKLYLQEPLLCPPPALPAPQPPFGQCPNQQYLALLAPMALEFTHGKQQDVGFDINPFYRFPLDCDETMWLNLGLDVPIKAKKQTLHLDFQGDFLNGEAGTSVSSAVLEQFFTDFQSIEDFLNRAVFYPKGLNFVPNQHIFGLGDISVSAAVDVGKALDIDSVQFGANMVVPTGRSGTGNVIGELTLGGGVYDFEFFGNTNVRTSSNIFNPTIRCALGFGYSPACNSRINCGKGLRIPQIITGENGEVVTQVPGLVVPVFSQYFTQNFNEVNTTVPQFADFLVPAKLHIGPRGLIAFGNYFYNLFNLPDMRLGLFYDYSVKAKDHVVALAPGEFNVDVLSDGTNMRAHRIGANLTYTFENSFEFTLGSQHIIAGMNTPKTNELVCIFTAVF